MSNPKDIIGIAKSWKKSAKPFVELEGMKVAGHEFGSGGIIVNPREAYEVAEALLIAVKALEEVAAESDAFAKNKGAKPYCENWLLNASLIAEHALKDISSLSVE